MLHFQGTTVLDPPEFLCAFLDSLSVTSPQLAKKFARGGLCPRAATTEISSSVRQQDFTIQSVPAPRTGFHGTACPCCLSI